MKELSKFLSYVLRHAPDSIGLQLDAEGWTDVVALIEKAQAAGKPIDHGTLTEIVATSDKKRFTLSEDGKSIRAAQGHSIDVDLGIEPQTPPDTLFHGTAVKSLGAITTEGLKAGKRTKVHLSADEETARRVGQRHGKPVVLLIDTKAMRDQGFLFWRADNGVWLTDHVPPQFLKETSS